ncbi:Expansin/pollen allergen [Macleaya cordata]|uniref:Expansin/pollen allergen n=1 Tax=Macleaya cordata TaxID=56857 RepID=A0A200QK39_MACCD|nr:Expansin/pollen allergen [Macleaya cordata]
MAMIFFLCLFFFLISYSSACDRCVHQSKAAYFSSPSSLSSGACGYGSLAIGFNGGHLAAGVPSLFRDGIGCGACFQIRCKKQGICSSGGTKVILTDLNHNNKTDFVLSNRAFKAMARDGMAAKDLLKLGMVDIEYKSRVPCDYKNQNLSVRVEETSQSEIQRHLAIKFLYQGGQTDIVAVDVAQVGSSNWGYMSRNNGTVWETSRVPNGPLQFRMVVTGGFDGKMIWAQKEVLPADWKAGGIYDSGVQITDIAQEGCSPCDQEHWRNK